MNLNFDVFGEDSKSREMNKIIARETTIYNIIEEVLILVMIAKANLEDSPTFQQAMSSPDADEWYKAMKKEYNSLIELDAWKEVSRESVNGANILDTIWSLRRKHYPDY